MNAKPSIERVARRPEVEEFTLGCGRFVGVRYEESPLVALAGSFRTPGEDGRSALLQRLTTRLLACGTVRRDRRGIADALERRGASLSFDAGAARIRFSAFARADDVPKIAELLAECLREPRFDPDDVAIERAQLAAELRYEALDPGAQASALLSRRLFEAGHPRHEPPLEQRIGWLEDLGVDDVRAFHEALFGAHAMFVVAVGAIDPGAWAADLERRLHAWQPRDRVDARPATPAPLEGGGTTRIRHPGSANSSVLIGTRLALDEADGVTAWLANRILGGSSTSRLAASLREHHALTYSVRSELVDPHADLDGVWQVAMALGPDKLERGIAVARTELERFAEEGIAPDELDRQRRAAIGSAGVESASLQGMAAFLLRNLERGGGVHLDAFAEALAAVSSQQIRRVAAALRTTRVETVIVGPLREA